jgi:hypothetical protein
MSESECRKVQDAATTAHDDTTTAERRQALRTLSKAVYVAPAVIATLAATKAMAASEIVS